MSCPSDGLRLYIPGTPVTKKNSMQIVMAGGHPRIVPSRKYKEYEQMALRAIGGQLTPVVPISRPVNMRCIYKMPTRRRVDLVNLIEATCDVLVRAGVIEDDHSGIVAGHDGSRVEYDKENPGTEILISEMEEVKP